MREGLDEVGCQNGSKTMLQDERDLLPLSLLGLCDVP